MISEMTMNSTTTNRVAVSFDQSKASLRVVGRVTEETVPLLAAVLDTLRQHPVTQVFIDLSGVTVVDRSGAHFLANARREYEEGTSELHWTAASGTVSSLAAV